jgi:hypothetical protein
MSDDYDKYDPEKQTTLRAALEARLRGIWSGQDTVPTDYVVEVERREYLRGRGSIERLENAVRRDAERALIDRMLALSLPVRVPDGEKVERVARAIYVTDRSEQRTASVKGDRAPVEWERQLEGCRNRYRAKARAAIAALDPPIGTQETDEEDEDACPHCGGIAVHVSPCPRMRDDD